MMIRILAIAPLLVALGNAMQLSDRDSAIRAQITYVASALANHNPADALAPFDRSFQGYEKLRNYFQGLTQSFDITSAIEMKDADESDTGVNLTVTWSLTLTEPEANATIRRTADVKLRLVPKGGKWKVVDLAPLEFFHPQQNRPK